MRVALVLLIASAAAVQAQDAAMVLKRYVDVTGGAALYKEYSFVHVFYTITNADKSSDTVDYFQTRDGKLLIETDTDKGNRMEGVSDGRAWTYADGKGARLLSGKEAERLIAKSKAFSPDEWQAEFSAAHLSGVEAVDGVTCRHLKLTRTDGSTVDRFYDVKTGLLVREGSTEFDAAGTDQATTVDIQRYDTFFGVRRPANLHVKQGTQIFDIQVNNVTYSRAAEEAGMEVPHDVLRLLVAARSKNGDLPNPVDLIDKYVEATGGKNAYEAIKTQVIKAEVSLTTDNLKFPVVIYSAGGKEYSSSDIPSIGKIESGDDGRIGWERSVTLGPKLRPHAAGSEFTGPRPSDVISWYGDAVDMDTEAQDQVNGTPCYRVRMGKPGSNAPTACFDSKTALLLKITYPSTDGAVEQFYSDYQTVGGVKVCYHLETSVAGHRAAVQITDIEINQPVPAGIFDLPADVAALKAKRDAAAQNVPAAPGAPTLKKPPQ